MSKTSTLSPRVRGFIEWRLEHYREDKRILQEYRAELLPSNTARYGLEAAGGHGGNGRPTEAMGVKLTTNPYILELERAVAAVEHVTGRLSPERLRLVELVYWRGTHTIEGAAAALHVSRRTAYRWANEILTAVALELGYTAI